MRSSSHFGTPGVNIRFPKNYIHTYIHICLKNNIFKMSSDYFYILNVVDRITLMYNLFQDVCEALKHIYEMFC